MQPSLNITVGARSSNLSRKQLDEVLEALHVFHPEVTFEPIFVETVGDRNKQISLRTLDKTDFFTRDIDQMQLEGRCRISIHSAKDLPEPLPKGLVLAALTEGVDPSDSLVLRDGERVRENMVVATSSERREEMVKRVEPMTQFVDIRGTIEERLEKLFQHEVDGVVIAEAALHRLGFTHLSRITLPGETVPFQGQLAILIREEDQEMENLFACLDIRTKSSTLA